MIRSLALGIVFFAVLLSLGLAIPEFRTFVSLGMGKATPSQAPDPLRGVELEARNVYVFDVASRRPLFEKNASEPRPLASLAKLMTALLAEELVPPGIMVPVSPEARRQKDDSGILAGGEFRKEELLDFMLAASSNGAAYAFAEFIGAGLDGNDRAAVSKFVALMNERARNLGMAQTSFLNPHGLDQIINNQRISGANGTARDVSLLMEYIFKTHSRILAATRSPEVAIISGEGKKAFAENTNKALGTIPRFIGGKTGFTSLAGGNLVFVFDAGFSRPILVSLLGSGEESRFEDARKIAEAVLEYYAKL